MQDWSDVRLEDLHKLLGVSEELREDGCTDLCPLRFLLADRYPLGVLEKLDTTGKLMHRLADDGYSGTSLVPELFVAIGRSDILRQLKIKMPTVKIRLDNTARCDLVVSPSRKLLHEICLELEDCDLYKLRNLCSEEIPNGVKVKCGHHLFRELDSRGHIDIKEEDLSYLKTKLEYARLIKLSNRVAAFIRAETSSEIMDDSDELHGAFGGLSLQHAGPPIQNDVDVDIDIDGDDTTLTANASALGDIVSCQARPAVTRPSCVADDTYTGSDRYRMTSDPLGICLILGLEKLTSSIGRGMREDCDRLQETFKSLKFDVDELFAVDSKVLSEKLNKYSQKVDHTKYDCFVVCIIGHGRKDEVLTMDGIYHSLYDILGMFGGKRCPSLNGKPKLFFVNTCQGEKDMSAVRLGGESSSRPEMGDFLVSQATFPGYYAYMGPAGSAYIRILCDVLKNKSKSKPLRQMLDEVNKRVGEDTFPVPDVEGEVAQCTWTRDSIAGEVWFSTEHNPTTLTQYTQYPVPSTQPSTKHNPTTLTQYTQYPVPNPRLNTTLPL